MRGDRSERFQEKEIWGSCLIPALENILILPQDNYARDALQVFANT